MFLLVTAKTIEIFGGGHKFLNKRKETIHMSLGTKTAQTPAEFQNLVAIYESNGFKIKKQSDTEYTLLKKTCKKKRKTFKGAPWWLVIKLTALCCTIFTAPFIYNALHTKKESVTIVLAK